MQTHIDDLDRPMEDIVLDLVGLARRLDHSHRQQRKIQFLLDIRGYLAMNHIAGDYAEFGLYRGEMLASAHGVLDHLGLIPRYLGFDGFTGEPEMTPAEARRLPFVQAGDYRADEADTRRFLGSVVGAERLKIVVGDFREAANRQGEPGAPVAIGVIDCNLESSVDAALDALLPAMAVGGALLLDDYFLNLSPQGPLMEQSLANHARVSGRRLVEFQTYPPCARAFLVFNA